VGAGRQPLDRRWPSSRSTTPIPGATSGTRGWRGASSRPTSSSISPSPLSGEPAQASAISFGLIPAAFNGQAERPVEIAAVPDLLTLVTYAFLHADLMHLLGNMIFLWVFADNVEDALGHLRYLVFYMLCAIAAGYAFVLSDPTSHAPVIGASGAVGGNIAAYLLLHPRAKVWILLFLRIPLRLSAMYVLGFWVIFQFVAASRRRRRGQYCLVGAYRRACRGGRACDFHAAARRAAVRPVRTSVRDQPAAKGPWGR
jgi:membrane associated rhomboid family serine protease